MNGSAVTRTAWARHEPAGPYGAVVVRGAGLAQPNAAARVRAMRRARRDARARALRVRRILLTR